MSRLFAAVVVLVTAGPLAAADYPHVHLKNEHLKVKVYLPDAEKGFYRGTRFDWAGVCGEVEFAGHKVFGPWKDTHDPTNHDDIVGPCEEFGNEKPLGYDEAKPGETFLKIGVGELEKPKEERYSFARKYRIVKPAGWKAVPSESRLPGLAWEMKASHSSGYGYEYRKEVVLSRTEPILVISHSLINTGTKPITTDFYNHNFFNIDGDPIGPNYRFTFPFDPKAENLRGRFGELVAVDGRELRFKDKLIDGFVMAGLTGFDPKNVHHRTFELRHRPSGLLVRVSQARPFAKFNVWGVKTTICPEPFTRIELPKPGDSMVWRIGYDFNHDPAEK